MIENISNLKKYTLMVDLIAKTISKINFYIPTKVGVRRFETFFAVSCMSIPVKTYDVNFNVAYQVKHFFLFPKGIVGNGFKLFFYELEEEQLKIIQTEENIQTFLQQIDNFFNHIIINIFENDKPEYYTRVIYPLYLFNYINKVALPINDYLWSRDTMLINKLVEKPNLFEYEDFNFLMERTSEERKNFYLEKLA